MAFITETNEWVSGIYQYEQDDVVEGGPDGIDNIQAKALAARTNYLKALLENLQSDKQDQDPTLVAIAALATAADKFIYFTGADEAALGTVTAYGRSLLAGADAAAVRALLSAVSQAELNAAIAGLVNSSPATLDTLKELADALGDDPNFATTMTNALAARVQITDLQKGTHVTATAGGTADAITAAYTPAITTDTAGRIPEVTLSFKATAANTAAGTTFNAGTGAFGLVKGASTAIVAGDIPGAGAIVQVRGRRGASAAEDKWVLLNPAFSLESATTVTPASDPSFADNSSKAASTSWIRAALSSIFAAAGFSVTLAPTGHIKFPSLLGGLVIQWGRIVHASGSTAVTFNGVFEIPFPNEVWVMTANNLANPVDAVFFTCATLTTAGFSGTVYDYSSGPVTTGELMYIAVGR